MFTAVALLSIALGIGAKHGDLHAGGRPQRTLLPRKNGILRVLRFLRL